ncbi:MAG TPA: lytic transglycosylase domain-containing protein [Rhizomicrobium sp.]
MAFLALAPGWGLAASASAQVLDIRPDGSTATYRGPVIASPDGVTPLSAKIHSPGAVAAVIRGAAGRHAVSPDLVAAVAWQESRMRQAAVSPKGARGVMQLMPGTARQMGVDAADLSGNVDGGAAYLAAMLERFDGDVIKALAAYNAGPQAVQRYAGVPPYAETQTYVNAVLERMADNATGVQP